MTSRLAVAAMAQAPPEQATLFPVDPEPPLPADVVPPLPEPEEDLELPAALREFRLDTRLVRRRSAADSPSFKSPADVAAFVSDLTESDRERLLVLYVDRKNVLIGIQPLTIGTRGESLAPFDVIGRTALLSNAAGVFLVHNHPSGSAEPSPEDVNVTRTLTEALKPFDVDVIDHIIIGDSGFTSLKQAGRLDQDAPAGQDLEYPTDRLPNLRFVRGTAPASSTAAEMLAWQYRQIIKELQLLQDHAADPSCPCSLSELGEWCLAKHALSVAGYAGETAAMENDDNRAGVLVELQDDAQAVHVESQAATCGTGEPRDIINWSRDWRKRIEPWYYVCLVPEPATAAMAQQPKVRISGTCDHDGPCRIKVRAIDEAVEDVDSADAVSEAVEEATRVLLARRAVNVSDRTFAVGQNGVTRYQFRIAVAEAGELVVSNDPHTFELNADYPPEMQPRQRDRTATRLQVEKIAANLDPDALLEDFRVLDRGAPIVGPDMVVEGGNGRTMGIIRAAADYPDLYAAYRDRLLERAPEFGIEPAAVEALETPVLVRIRLSDVDRVAFAQETNAPAGISTSAIEQARTDAANVTLDMLRTLDVGESESLGDALRATRNSRFVQAFLGTMSENEQAELVDSGGRLNQDGIRRMVLAVFLAALPGDAGVRLAELAFESIDLQLRNVVNAIARSLGDLAQAEALTSAGERDPELSIGEDLAAAVNVFARVKRTPGMDVEKFLAQAQMFERELTDFQEELLRFLDTRSRSARRMADAFGAYARSVIAAPPPAQATLIPGAELTKEDLWAAAVRSTEDALAAQDPRDRVDWCNLEPDEADQVWGWQPLQDLLATVVETGAIVEVCGIGFADYQVQVTIDVRSVLPRDAGTILRAAGQLGSAADLIMTPDPGILVYQVTIPEPTRRDLDVLPPGLEPSVPRPEPGLQPALFQAAPMARMGQSPRPSFLDRLRIGIISGIGLGVGGKIVAGMTDRLSGPSHRDQAAATQPCGSLARAVYKLDISGAGDFIRARIHDPDLFDPDSFRTIVRGEHRIVVACLKGKWDPDRQQGRQCVDGLELQAILHPRRCTSNLVAQAEEMGIPIIDDPIMATVESALHAAELAPEVHPPAGAMIAEGEYSGGIIAPAAEPLEGDAGQIQVVRAAAGQIPVVR